MAFRTALYSILTHLITWPHHSRRPCLAAHQRRSIAALIFDTETSGSADFSQPASHPCQPDLVQLGLILIDTENWTKRMQISVLIQDVQHIEPAAQQVHGIAVDQCHKFGVPRSVALQLFEAACQQAHVLVAHNLQFDKIVMEAALHREQQRRGGRRSVFTLPKQQVCTMQYCTDLLQLPGKYNNNGSYKWPSLQESYAFFNSGKTIVQSHDALVDANACLSVFQGLVERGVVDLTNVPEEKDPSCSENNNALLSSAAVIAEEATASSSSVIKKPIAASTAASISNQFLSSSSNNKGKAAKDVVAKPGELVLEYRNDFGFCVRGNTYHYKETLKAMGAKWDPAQMVWNFADRSQLESAQRLVGISSVNVTPSKKDDNDNSA